MYMLYLDESGTVADPSQKYFVLAGVCVYERQTHWIEQDLNAIAARFDAANPHNVELHGAPMRSGREMWKPVPQDARNGAILDALRQGVVARRRFKVCLFGAVVKKASLPGKDPIQFAFEQIASRFDAFLMRINKEFQAKNSKHAERGLILFDKANTERSIQTMARDFKYTGHPWGKTHCYAEVPVFLDSKASRLIQLADLVAYALFRFYEHNDNTYYSVINRSFDTVGGVEHGLHVHL